MWRGNLSHFLQGVIDVPFIEFVVAGAIQHRALERTICPYHTSRLHSNIACEHH